MDQLKKLLLSLSLKQRISLGAVALAVIGGLFALSHWNRERDFKPLYTGLAPEDAAAVLAKVREGGTEFRIGESGSSVLVPSSKVAEMRLQLAAAGIPKTGRIGFELFDKTNFGTSDFAEQINYHRALEGEIERSIMSLSDVEMSRVHITFPKDSIFLESKQPAKASVLIKLKPGGKLSPQNVAGICQLVASAVEGLTPDAVSIVDMRGSLLNPRRKTLVPDGSEPDDAALEYRGKFERELLAKINTTLEPVLGVDKFRAGVSIECDFTSGEQSEETFDPSKSVMVSSQKTEDVGGTNSASGVPGTPSNLPRPVQRPGGGATTVSRRTESIAYQSSRMVRKLRLPQGSIKRMSVSVLVDNIVRFEGSGAKAKRIVEPPPAERIKAIRDLVAGVVGFSADRGDQIVVESLPFESTLKYDPPQPTAAPVAPKATPLPPWLQKLIENKMYLGAGAGVVVVLVAAAVFLLLRRKKRAKVKIQPQIEGATQAPDGPPTGQELAKKIENQLAEQHAERERLETEALRSLKLPQVTTQKAEILTKHINEEAKKDPKVAAQILRSWLNDRK